MQDQLTYTGRLVVRSCWCGIRHAIPETLNRQVDENGMTAYCPLGHEYVAVGETVSEQLERERAQLARERQRHEATRELLAHEGRSHAATRGHLTRRKRELKRVTAGVCPCCNRTFQDLARHMSGQHPTYDPAA